MHVRLCSWLVKRGGVGLFRARYDDTQLKALVDTLRHLTVDFQDGKITEAALDRHKPDCVGSYQCIRFSAPAVLLRTLCSGRWHIVRLP